MRLPFYKILLSATGVTVVLQFLALLRQILTTSYFGIGRDLDLFWTVYAMAGVSVFGMSVVIESTYTALLVGIRETQGDLAFRQAFRPYVVVAFGIGVIASVVFLLLVPVLALFFGAGFSDEEKNHMQRLAVWFVPWVAAIIPYYAVSAVLKAAWSFRWAFAAEIVVVTGSLLVIATWHTSIENLPAAYGAGYWFALVWLLWRAAKLGASGGTLEGFPWGQLWRRFITHYSALQVTTLNSLAERFWMSFVPAGGITALAIVQQLTMGISGLLSLRDSYLAPLAIESGRNERFRRLAVGIALLASVVGSYVGIMAPEIIQLLFQYGKVSNSDVTLISVLLMIGSLGLIPSSISTIFWRVLQLTGRHRVFVYAYLLNTVSTLVLGWVLVGKLEMGAAGVAWIAVINSCITLVFGFVGVKAIGVALSSENWRLLVFGAIVAPISAVAAGLIGRNLHGSIEVLAASASCYAIFVSLFGFFVRNKVKSIIKGHA